MVVVVVIVREFCVDNVPFVNAVQILILHQVSDYMTAAMRVKLLSTLKPTVREFHHFIKQRADLVSFSSPDLVCLS